MIEQMMADYNTGKFTVKMIGEKYGICTGKAYYLLRDAGCKFIRTMRHPMSAEARSHMGQSRKGKKLTEKQRMAISEANRCNYNGLNGYGHTKKHNMGYVLAYAPCHPNCHADGYVMLHTVLMERAIGRYLTQDEVVHHINHNKADNRLENLQLMNKHEHSSMHMKERQAKRRNDLLTT